MCGDLGVLYVQQIQIVTWVADAFIIHMLYTCFTCLGYTPALHVWNNVLQVFYMYITDVWITCVIHINITNVLHVYYTCNTYVAHFVVYNYQIILNQSKTNLMWLWKWSLQHGQYPINNIRVSICYTCRTCPTTNMIRWSTNHWDFLISTTPPRQNSSKWQFKLWWF